MTTSAASEPRPIPVAPRHGTARLCARTAGVAGGVVAGVGALAVLSHLWALGTGGNDLDALSGKFTNDGVPMARAFLTRIGIKSAISDQVERLVENHMVASSIGRDPTPRAALLTRASRARPRGRR